MSESRITIGVLDVLTWDAAFNDTVGSSVKVFTEVAPRNGVMVHKTHIKHSELASGTLVARSFSISFVNVVRRLEKPWETR